MVAGTDTHVGGEGPGSLKWYWTRGEGLAKWAPTPHPWTALYTHLQKFMGPSMAKRAASLWFFEVFGLWSGERKGRNPVGPG
jgi:hypothetical protein